MRDAPPNNTTLKQWERLARANPSALDRAQDTIEDFVAKLLPSAKFELRSYESAGIEDQGQSAVVILGRSLLDDFAATLDGTKPKAYSAGIRNTIYSRVYIALGLQNMIPNVVVSDIVLNDERDWHRQVLVRTHFDDKYARGIYLGLKALESSLTLGLSDDLDVPDVRRDIDAVKNLSAFYDDHKHLNAGEVGVENLSFLKAAMLCWILDLEAKRASETAPRKKKAFSAQIFEIFESLQHVPWDRIKLPDAIYDFVAQRVNTEAAGPSRVERSDIDALLAKVNPRLVDRRRSAWAVLTSDIDDRVSQATNSMVEVLKAVIGSVCGSREFRDVLNEQYPDSSEFILKTRAWISETKDGLERVKHHPDAQSPILAEALMEAAELIIRVLLRTST